MTDFPPSEFKSNGSLTIWIYEFVEWIGWCRCLSQTQRNRHRSRPSWGETRINSWRSSRTSIMTKRVRFANFDSSYLCVLSADWCFSLCFSSEFALDEQFTVSTYTPSTTLPHSACHTRIRCVFYFFFFLLSPCKACFASDRSWHLHSISIWQDEKQFLIVQIQNLWFLLSPPSLWMTGRIPPVHMFHPRTWRAWYFCVKLYRACVVVVRSSRPWFMIHDAWFLIAGARWSLSSFFDVQYSWFLVGSSSLSFVRLYHQISPFRFV